MATRTEAVEIAGMHTATFARAAMSSGLHALSSSGTRRAFQDFDIGEIERLRDAKDGSIPIDAVVERLGIRYRGVEQLVVQGLLDAEGHAALPSVYRLARITPRSLDELVAGLVAALRTEDMDGCIPLRIAVKCIRGEKPWRAIFCALLNGERPFRFDADVRRLCRGILVATTSVDLLESPYCSPDPVSPRFDRRHAGLDPGFRRILASCQGRWIPGQAEGDDHVDHSWSKPTLTIAVPQENCILSTLGATPWSSSACAASSNTKRSTCRSMVRSAKPAR